MASRGQQTFKKRQKEQQRKERQQEKMAQRLARKDAPPASDTDDEVPSEGEVTTGDGPAQVLTSTE